MMVSSGCHTKTSSNSSLELVLLSTLITRPLPSSTRLVRDRKLWQLTIQLLKSSSSQVRPTLHETIQETANVSRLDHQPSFTLSTQMALQSKQVNHTSSSVGMDSQTSASLKAIYQLGSTSSGSSTKLFQEQRTTSPSVSMPPKNLQK